jgi:hypothetical protein
MKPIVCENCILQGACSQICEEVTNKIIMLDHEIDTNYRYVYTKRNRMRKRVKRNDIKRYNSLIIKWNKYIDQRRHIWLKHIVSGKHGDRHNFFGPLESFKTAHIWSIRKPLQNNS